MRPANRLVSVSALFFVCACGQSDDSTVETEDMLASREAPAQSEAVVELEIGKTLFFRGQTPDAPVTVEPGVYEVGETEDSYIQLRSVDGDVFKIEAELGNHEEEIQETLVLAEEESDDAAHIVILREDGTALDAAASYSGIVERGTTATRARLSRQRIALGRTRYPQKSPGTSRTQQTKHVASAFATKESAAITAAPSKNVRLFLGQPRLRPAPVIKQVKAPTKVVTGGIVPVNVVAADRYGLDAVTVSLGKEIYRYRARGRREVKFTAKLEAVGLGPSQLSVQAVNTSHRVSDPYNSLITMLPDVPTHDEPPITEIPDVEPTVPTDLPVNFDLRAAYPVHPVPRNQGSCGSCYIVSPVMVAEWAYAIDLQDRGLPYEPTALSAQAVMDCGGSPPPGFGCQGGWPRDVYGFFEDSGVPFESEYPYTAHDGTCQSFEPVVKLTGSSFGPISEVDVIKASIHAGRPVTTSMKVHADFNSYSSGIYRHESGGYVGNKAITLIGWGTEGGVDYWIVQNSWGTWWGDNGYFKIAMDDVSLQGTYAYYYTGIVVSG